MVIKSLDVSSNENFTQNSSELSQITFMVLTTSYGILLYENLKIFLFIKEFELE